MEGKKRPLVGGSIGRRAKFAQRVRVPVGLEKVLYLAARDPALEARLLGDRAEAIAAIGIELRPSERAMLAAAPPEVLRAMIGRIDASNPRKRRFMNLVAAAATSLAAGTALASCDGQDSVMAGGASDIDTDADVDAGGDASAVDTDTDTYAGGGARTDLDPGDREKK